METPKLNLFQRLWLEILWGGMRLFAMLPYWFKYYVVENLFFCLLYYVLRYRRQVVWDNLRNSFPEKSERELWIIRRRFYRTLAEIFVDTVDLAHKSTARPRNAGHSRLRGAGTAGARPRLDCHAGSLRVLGILFVLGPF